MQKHNRMLWRIARGIMRSDAEAEDVVQNAYVRALTSIAGFRGDSSLATWLSRIVVNEALRRRGQQRRPVDLEVGDVYEQLSADYPGSATMAQLASPETAAAREQIRRLVEAAIDTLPAQFRMVFMMRIVEQMSINDTAASLGIPVATAKTRLHRANQQLRTILGAEFASIFDGAFPFGGARCERLTQAVLQALPPEIIHKTAGSHPVPSHQTSKETAMDIFTTVRHAAATAFVVAAFGTTSGSAQPAPKPTDPQIAHIAYTADDIDIKNAKLALEKSRNKEVRAFADDMVRDHTAVNVRALALVGKLKVTPEDNPTSQSLVKQQDAERAKLASLSGSAFDKAYVANEAAYHGAVNGALETTLIPASQNAELKSLLQSGLGIFQEHQKHAEHLATLVK